MRDKHRRSFQQVGNSVSQSCVRICLHRRFGQSVTVGIRKLVPDILTPTFSQCTSPFRQVSSIVLFVSTTCTSSITLRVQTFGLRKEPVACAAPEPTASACVT
jgi:hypothetical protein